MIRTLACILVLAPSAMSFAEADAGLRPNEPLTVAETASKARTPDGRTISWVEHRIDDEALNGGTAIRGGDGLAMADIDLDGFEDIVSVHEDSNHLRIAFGTGTSEFMDRVTVGEGSVVGAIEDVAIGDLNGDGWPDLVGACEDAHLVYFQNPGQGERSVRWPRLVLPITQDRGSWLRVFITDLDQDGRLDVVAPNKGAADIIDPDADHSTGRAVSLFRIDGDPLQPDAWREEVLFRTGVPNTAMPVDIDGDGDQDIFTADRLERRMTMLEVLGLDTGDGLSLQPHPIKVVPGVTSEADRQASSGAIQSVFADLDADGRPDLVVGVTETSGDGTERRDDLAVGWLRQPHRLDQPWVYFRIGDTLPDVVVGLAVADIDGDGDPDVMTGGYSGLNILTGAYSGASRDHDDPRVTAASTVGRIAWFENPGIPGVAWNRHDVSRRVRGMVDLFIPRDIDGDGDIDFVATRGNSGSLDGVFWLEQLRSDEPRAAFTPARAEDSRALPLPPEDWRDRYDETSTYVPPNHAPAH